MPQKLASLRDLRGKWGWKTSVVKKRKYAVDPDTKKVERKPDDQEISHPDLKTSPNQGFVRPNPPRARLSKGRFVVGQYFISASTLDDLRNDPSYKNIPTFEELATILANKEEPAADSLSASK